MTQEFFTRLHSLEKKLRREQRQWIYVAYDQLTHTCGPLAQKIPREVGIVLLESLWQLRQKPYHRQKIALLWANQRHFALEQLQRGVWVDYIRSPNHPKDVLWAWQREHGPLVAMEPSEHLWREALDNVVSFVPNDSFLSRPEDFLAMGPPPWRMDAFYRHMRKRTGILMVNQKPLGGKYSYDS